MALSHGSQTFAQFFAQDSIRNSVEETASGGTGFSVRKEDKQKLDALDDFARYVDKKAWERAFAAITPLLEADLKAMVPAADGFFLPGKLRVRQAVAGLPPEGKQAFRLFNDAKAKQLLTQAIGAQEIPNLRKVFDQYFITAVGDTAADRLGDALYESGDFSGAADAYGAILRDFPDSSLPRPRLEVKRALALHRAGSGQQAKAAAEQVRKAYPDEQITIAGKRVGAADFLDAQLRQLASTTQPAATTQPGTTQPVATDHAVTELPASDTPRWQVQFVDDALQNQLRQAVANMGWNQLVGTLLNYVPPTASDGERVYLNYMGIVMAFDARTGKLLWRSRKFSELADKLQQFVYSSGELERYGTVAAADSVLVTGVNLDRLNYGQEPVRLVCLDGKTGAVRWSTANGAGGLRAMMTGGADNTWSAASPPIIDGNQVYYIAHPVSGQDMTLSVLSLDKGAPLWTLSLGSAQAGGTNWRGMPNSPVPQMKMIGDTLYVLTNNGALLAVDTQAHSIKWAFTYDAPTIGDSESGNFNPMGNSMGAAGAVIAHDGILYVKETGGREMFAIDPASPKLLWRRPVSANEGLAAIQGQNLYLQGAGTGMISLADRELKWSGQLPADIGTAHALIAPDALLVFGPRGIYQLSLVNGDAKRIFRGADRESAGGTIGRVGDSLVTVSNERVTAYPVAKASVSKN